MRLFHNQLEVPCRSFKDSLHTCILYLIKNFTIYADHFHFTSWAAGHNGVSCFTVKSILSACALEAAYFTHHLCVCWILDQDWAYKLLVSQMLPVAPPLKIRFPVSAGEKNGRFEHEMWKTASSRTSFCTGTLKHSTVRKRSKQHFWIKWDFNKSFRPLLFTI